jgi:hypothetical protein
MNKFYVYTLSNPSTNTVFYVGKGCGSRAYSHERKVLRNPKKYSRLPKDKEILDILSLGLSVSVSFIKDNMSESEALILEAETIKSIGISNLKNIKPAGCASGFRFGEKINWFRNIGAAYLRLPEIWKDSELKSCDGISLKSIYKEISEAEKLAMLKANSSEVVRGFSLAIESHNGRLFSLLPPSHAD